MQAWPTPTPPRPATLSARTLGALAVLGVVVAFSLSSTLVKRAESPGVLVAFWRMALVSVIWNVYLRSTGRRVTWKDVRQVWVPGVFFGVNLAVFFAGATHNSVANAALIGSLSPFLIVPLGAVLFDEYFNSRALLFAVLAFGGAVMVLLNAPPNGDASVRGNVLGVLAMLLWMGYVVSTRHFRRKMDVATFMATVCPIAVVAVLPLAIANGDMSRAECDRLDLHADPLAPDGRGRPRPVRLRPEDHPDRHHRHRPGRAAGARGHLVLTCCWASSSATCRPSASPSSIGGLFGFLFINERDQRARRAPAAAAT